MKIVIETGNAWRCENMDLNAPITEEYIVVLLSDGSTEAYDERQEYRFATDEEYKQYYHSIGCIFVGDCIKVIKGRNIPKGTLKTVKSFYRYYIAGTYKHSYVDYVVFDDGTKTSIQNVRVVGFENVDYTTEYERICISGRA